MMATYEIDGPDGKTYELDGPEGMTRDQVVSAIRRRLDRQQTLAQNAPPPPAARQRIEGNLRPGIAGMANAATAGTDPLNRFLRGVTDVPIGAAQLVANVLPDSLNVAMGGKTADQINQELAQREAEYQVSRTPQFAPDYIDRYVSGDAPLPDSVPMDWARLAGNVTASLPLGVLGGESTVGALTAGGAMGLLTPQYGGEFSWSDKLEQAGAGALGSAGGSLLGRGIAGAIRPNVSPEVRTLLDAGVNPTPGQTLGGMWNATEQKLTSIFGLGDAISSGRQSVNREFNRAVYRDVLAPIGGTVPQGVGREAIDNIATQIGDAYDNILPSLTLRADNQLFADIQNLARYTQQMPPDTAAQLRRDIANYIVNPLQQGTITGRAFKDLESSVGRAAARLRASGDAYQKLHGEALAELQGILRDALERSNQGTVVNVNGQWVDATERLRDINSAFANLVRLERAAGSAGAADGVFTPNQFLSAVRMSDGSSRRAQFARGNARMQELADAGRNVLGNTVPDSGTPGRLATAATGATLALNPALAIPGAMAALPYTDLGRRLTAGLLTARPAVADPIGQAALRALPGLLSGGAAIATPTTP